MLDIIIKTTKVTAINKDLAAFNCGGDLSGVIHSPASGIYTVVIDGGYTLATNICPHCVIKSVHNLADKIQGGNEKFGMNYESYKAAFLSGSNSRCH
ncbi:TPA: DNA breaking-rejoining protein [Enterobacter sichuanensis]|nr:DNA breaking-rejoining protein [Enterobacter sichuanensis]